MIDRRKRIAVVGAGVSGLTAAWGLSTLHEVTLFESASYLGGHANTVFVKGDIDLPVDTGFIVFNEQNYPFFTAILKLLNVSTLPTSMSFGVSVDGGNFEYSSASLPKAIFSYSNLRSERFRTLVSGGTILHHILTRNEGDAADSDYEKCINILFDETDDDLKHQMKRIIMYELNVSNV